MQFGETDCWVLYPGVFFDYIGSKINFIIHNVILQINTFLEHQSGCQVPWSASTGTFLPTLYSQVTDLQSDTHLKANFKLQVTISVQSELVSQL